MIAGQDYAEKSASLIGGNLEGMVRDVALKSVAADIQIESGLRVLDHAFGQSTSAELKNAARSISKEADSPQKAADAAAFEHAESERERIQKEMVDVLRDPSLNINARKARLHDLLDQFDVALHGVKQIDPKKINLGAARSGVDGLRADVFENMLTVDATGGLTLNGKKVGTLREMMTQVQQTNAAYKRHGIEEEFVISVSTPTDPTRPREVKILSRKPRDLSKLPLGAKEQTHAPVDPSSPDEVGRSSISVPVYPTMRARLAARRVRSSRPSTDPPMPIPR